MVSSQVSSDKHAARRRIGLLPICAVLLGPAAAFGATMFSTNESFMGAGTFYGPGKIKDSVLFDATIGNISMSSSSTFITPLVNNGGAKPNLCAENEIGNKPTGKLSDGVTLINESVNVCSFNLNGAKVLVAIIDGGPHRGQQIAVTMGGDGQLGMIMTMDFAIDMGVGKAGVIRMPFFGTTGEVTIQKSLQTQLGLPGGVDQAGSLKAGDKIRGRFGDYNNDGMLDGAIVVAGNIPLDSIFMPGAPYALIRYFETDVPFDGRLIGKLPGARIAEGASPPPLRISAPKHPAAELNPQISSLGPTSRLEP
jgi:hypothetical protein